MKDNSQNINQDVLEQAIKEGIKYPKVTVYSPITAAVLRYREITTPRFKLSLWILTSPLFRQCKQMILVLAIDS
jgi:hypothetical protein